MFPRGYFARTYFPATYWPGGAEVEAPTVTPDVPDENRVVIGADDNVVVVD